MARVSDAFVEALKNWKSPEPRRTTALLIPCPWSGDETEPVPYSYRLWFSIYWRTRILRHWLGIHDYQYVPALRAHCCTWCGRTGR